MNRQQAVANGARSQQSNKEQQILNVASEHFLNHGYEGTSINAMARDSGISKESIYRNYSSKKVLFEAVIAKELQDYQHKLHAVDLENESMSLEDALTKMAQSILGTVTSDRTLSLRRLIFQETRVSPDIGNYYHEIGPNAAYKNLAGC